MESLTPQRRERQPWNEALYEFKQLRFLQYFCGFEDTPIDKDSKEVPNNFDVAKIKKELLLYIDEIPLEIFKIESSDRSAFPTPEIIRTMFIEHYGLEENSTPHTYKDLTEKYKIGGNKITKKIFRPVLSKLLKYSKK